MLITIHLARVRARSRYSLVPAVFMVITTLAALVWQTATFAYSVWAYLQNDKTWILRNVRPPIQTDPNLPWAAIVINVVFVIIGAVLFPVGLFLAVPLSRIHPQSLAHARARERAAAARSTREQS